MVQAMPESQLVCDQSKYAGWHATMVRRVGFQAVEIIEDTAAAVIKALRNFRQRKLTGGAMEKTRAKALFQ